MQVFKRKLGPLLRRRQLSPFEYLCRRDSANAVQTTLASQIP